jgi:hypothetical protein
MTLLSSSQRFLRLSLAGGLALGLATLSGCGIGTSAMSNPSVIPAFSGKAMGGQMPIIGATVKIYATTSSGYGVGSFLQEANKQGASTGQDTDSSGSFQFAGGYTCPAGQFLYLVTSGGNTGANTVNSDSVLVAALGRCEDLFANTTGGNYTGPNVYVSELTTIATAYALGNFSAVTGTGASAVVGIGAPATNNAAQVSGVSTGCVSNGITCTTTAAAGLAHAFQNAINLVNPFTSLLSANQYLPGNSSAVVPRELINSIGNVLVACVNSAGGAATVTGGVVGTDNSSCGTLFEYTAVGSTPPTNTFQSMLNLAANPTLGGSGTQVANLLALATPQTTVYSPSLSSSTGVNDLSIGINYPSGMGAAATTATATCKTPPCMGLTYPISGALDINDIYYVGNQVASSGVAGEANIFAFGSNGTLLGSTSNIANVKYTLGVSVDALGHGYFGDGSGSATYSVGVFSTGGGSVSGVTTTAVSSANSAKIYRTAVDRNNDVWAFGSATTGDDTLYEGPAGGTAFVGEAALSATPSGNEAGLAIDPNQNIWTTATTTFSILQNTGTAGSPSYSSTSFLSGTTGGNPAVGITFTGTSTAYTAYISSYNTTPGVQPYVPTLNGAEVSAINPGSLTTAGTKISGTYFNEADGTGNVWLADAQSHSVIQFNPTAGTGYRYAPCLGGSTTCASVFANYKPNEVEIDSTGSIWVPAVLSGTGGGVVQIIGAAAPTWPLLSLGLTVTP